MSSFLLFVRFFPYDPSFDVPLERIHLPLIYCLTWGVHVAYAAYIALKWRALKKKGSA